jgi:hypothetical protein
MLPLTPATLLARTPEFAKEEWDDTLNHLPLALDDPWTSILFSGCLAMYQPRKAFEKLNAMTKMDDGLTKAWALYWTAVQPDLGLPTPAPTPKPTPAPPTPAPATAPVVPSPPAPPAVLDCLMGENVKCPGSNGAYCMGNQCCPGGITCPSAPEGFTGCPKPKVATCVAVWDCLKGENVKCPGSNGAFCMGNQCCPGGITCPSALEGFTGCPNPKVATCEV